MNNGRTKKAARNITYSMFNQIVTIVLSFVSRTVFIWGLGPDYLGINGIFSDVLNLLSMADLGFNTAMIYSFYKPLAMGDQKKMAALTTFYKKMYTFIAIIITVIGIALIPLLPQLINLDRQIPHLTLYYLLSLFGVVSTYLCVYRTSILSADQNGFIITRISMITNMLKTLIMILSIIMFKNYTVYLVIGVVGELLNNIIASMIASKKYPFIKEKAQLSKEEEKSIFQNMGSVFLYKVSSVLLNATDNVLISTIISTTMVGLYSNYLMLQTKITSLFTLFFSSTTASIANLIVTEGEDKRYEIFDCEQVISFSFCGVIVPCYILLANDFIRIWLGEGYTLDNITIYAIGLNMYLSCVLQPLWSYREATGLYRKTKWVMVICAMENVILSILMGKVIGVSGIIFASAISRVTTYVWYEPVLLFKTYFSRNSKIFFKKLLINFSYICSIVFVLTYLLSGVYIDNIILWIFKACSIGGVNLGLIYILYRKEKGMQIVINRTKGLTKWTRAD